jgi:hypothetical protein
MDKFLAGTFMSKGLTVKTGQCHGVLEVGLARRDLAFPGSTITGRRIRSA